MSENAAHRLKYGLAVTGENKDSHVRRTTIYKLTDQAVLAKIAVEDEDSDVRVAAVERLTDDETLLAEVAKENEDSAVRRARSAS